MDLGMYLLDDKPVPTWEDTQGVKTKLEKWDRANYPSLMIMNSQLLKSFWMQLVRNLKNMI